MPRIGTVTCVVSSSTPSSVELVWTEQSHIILNIPREQGVVDVVLGVNGVTRQIQLLLNAAD